MPATPDEILSLAGRLARMIVDPDSVGDAIWADGSRITEREACDVFALAVYELRTGRRRESRAQRKALRLLRTLLTPAQAKHLRQCGYFYMQAVSGAWYRLRPQSGQVWGVDKHGRHFFEKRSFCIHDDPLGKEAMPYADVTIAHLLLLSCDEASFLETANMRPVRTDLWNGEWLRRVRQTRRELRAQRLAERSRERDAEAP